MRDDPEQGGPRPVNRRNLVMVLGGLGALLLIANVGDRNWGFFEGDDDRSYVSDGGDRSDSVGAAVEALEQHIEERKEERAEEREAQIERRVEAAVEGEVDDEAMEAAIEELKDGDPDRFLELLDKI